MYSVTATAGVGLKNGGWLACLFVAQLKVVAALLDNGSKIASDGWWLVSFWYCI